jgi:hypothetical protein
MVAFVTSDGLSGRAAERSDRDGRGVDGGLGSPSSGESTKNSVDALLS